MSFAPVTEKASGAGNVTASFSQKRRVYVNPSPKIASGSTSPCRKRRYHRQTEFSAANVAEADGVVKAAALPRKGKGYIRSISLVVLGNADECLAVSADNRGAVDFHAAGNVVNLRRQVITVVLVAMFCGTGCACLGGFECSTGICFPQAVQNRFP